MKFQPIFPSHIDSTMVTLYKSCPRKFFMQQLRGLQSPYPNIHLHFGGIFAKACEITRAAYFVDHLSLEEAVDLGQEHILKNFGDWDDAEADVKTLKNCLWAHDLYFKEAYPLDRDRFIPFQSSESGAPAIEFSFAIPIDVLHPETGNPLMYTGRADAIVADKSGLVNIWDAGELWALDEKTTKQMGSNWSKQWRLRGQFIGYTWAGQEFGYPVSGALVRGICVYKRNEPKFEQAFINISNTVIDRWVDQLQHTARNMVSDWIANDWRYDMGEACAAYGGCGYISMCELDNPEPYFEGKFVERRWDPLKREEVEGEQ